MMAEFAAQPALLLGLGLVFVITGCFAGTLAGLFGVGGGIILVPVTSGIMHLIGVDTDYAMRVAVATSLATILPTSIASLRAHHKRQGIDWVLLRTWSPMIIIGAIAGSFLARYVSGSILSICFGCMLLFMAWRMSKEQQDGTPQGHTVGAFGQRVMAGAIGCSAAMLGIGGGVIGVPALCYIGLPIRRAFGTASTFGVMVAVPGVANYLLAAAPSGIPLGGTWGLVHPLALLLLIPGALIFAPIGAQLTHKLPVDRLRRAFALLMAILSLKMLYAGLF